MGAEKWLNRFLRSIALLERVGNGIGILAFVGATVVLIGEDFWVATVIIFLESYRAFSQQSSSANHYSYKTTEGIKFKRMELGSGSLHYTNAAILTFCLWLLEKNYMIHKIILDPFPGYHLFGLLVLLAIIHKMGFYTLIGCISKKESDILLQLWPALTLLIVGFSLCYTKKFCNFDWPDYSLIPLWFGIYLLEWVVSPGDNCLGLKKVKVAAQLLRVTFIAAEVYALWTWFKSTSMMVMLVSSVLGNLQIPMALARIMLPIIWISMNETEVDDTSDENIKLVAKILNIMVLFQGVLYLAASILESFSFLLRRSVALHCGLVDNSGMESVDLYYEQAYEAFLQESVFDATNKMDLVTFAVDRLNPDASLDEKRAAGASSSETETDPIPLITTSTKALTTLISMLGWTVEEDADIRLFAAKVTTHLAPYIRISGIPGTMQMVSSLLDVQDQPVTQEISAQIVDDNGGDADDQQLSSGASSPTLSGSKRDLIDRQQTRNGSSYLPLYIEGGSGPAMQASSTQAAQNYHEGCYLIYRIRTCSRYIKKLWSNPQEDSNDDDSLLALGLQILEGLTHDLHNCAEIIRAMELLPKIIDLINCNPITAAAQREEITNSSLRLVAKLASIKGIIGITLRQELYENPFLFGNLAKILKLEASPDYPEKSKLAMNIIAKIARICTDKKTRQKIGTFQVIINKLVKEFLGDDENPLRAEAGEALVALATACPINWFAMLDGKNYVLIGDLTKKIEHGQHIYPAASLLQRLCQNSRELVLSHQGPDVDLSSTLTVVLGKIVNAEGKQMKALISLASQLFSAGITPVLNSSAIAAEFVEKLVGELKAHKIPGTDEFPDMRRLLVQLTLSIVEACDGYAFIFKQHGMMEALCEVERYTELMDPEQDMMKALSKVEQYVRLVSEERGALRTMVAKAKGLIGADTP
ncbi:hypothetical protein VPH35_132860 [Triticum aestivum]